jgi:hypothetical protein
MLRALINEIPAEMGEDYNRVLRLLHESARGLGGDTWLPGCRPRNVTLDNPPFPEQSCCSGKLE